MSIKIDKIIKIFVEQPNAEFHLREIARIVKISPSTLSKYLNNLKKEGILLSKKERGHILFRASLQNIYYKDLKLYYNIKKIRKSGLIEYLINEFNNPECIILFGSFRKSTNTASSDIDLFILTSIKKDIKLEKFEKILKYKIQLFIYPKYEIELMKKNNKELLNNIINGISLEGFFEVF